MSWLAHGCSVGTDGVCGNAIMVGTWMLCGNGWSLWERYHGWAMDALWERMEFVGMLSCYHGWAMDALRERMEFVGTLSWLGHGCSVGPDGVCGNVIMVGPWMLCGNGWSLWEAVRNRRALRARARISVRTSRICWKTQDMKHLCKRGKTLGRRAKPRIPTCFHERGLVPLLKSLACTHMDL